MHMPVLSARRRGSPAPDAPRAPSRPGGRLPTLASLRVGQKLLLIALSVALPLLGLLGLVLADQARQVAQVERQLRGLALPPRLAALNGALYAAVEDVLAGRASAVTPRAAAAVSAALGAARAGAGPLTTARLARLERDWQALAARPAAGSAELYGAYSRLLGTYQLPLLADVQAETGLSAEPDPGVSALLGLGGADLAEVGAQAQRLSLLIGAGVAGNPVLGWVERARVERGVLEQHLARLDSDLERADALRPGTRAALDAEVGGVVRAGRALLAQTDDMLAAYQPDPAVAERYAALRAGVQRAMAAAGGAARAALDERRAGVRGAVAAQLLALGLLLFGAAALGLRLTRSLTGPLLGLSGAARRLAAGDLSASAPVTTRDEVGELGAVFNEAVSRLRDNEEAQRRALAAAEALQANIAAFLDVTMDIADGDLTRRGTVTEDVLGNVVDSVNLMAEELGAVLREVQAASGAVTQGSRAMLGSAAHIEQGVQDTAQGTASTLARAQDLTRGVRQTAAIARASAEASRRALGASREGDAAVQGTLTHLTDLRQEAQAAAGRARALAQRSAEIDEIVDTVAHLAAEVGLLSLHASIEAAGAGAAGSRFAVVADEVRALSEASAQAAASIGARLSALRQDIGAVAQDLSDTAAGIERGHAAAAQAGAQLRAVGELSAMTAQLAQNIAAATQAQEQGVAQVTRAMTQIGGASDSAQQAARAGRDAAERLERLARDLDARLTRFTLPAPQGAPALEATP